MDKQQTSPLDEALRQALRRQDPGPDFTARVLALVQTAPVKRSRWEWLFSPLRPPAMRWAAAGALVCLLVAGGALEHRREQRIRAEGEVAKERLMLALRIAGGKLNYARDRVQQVTAGEARN